MYRDGIINGSGEIDEVLLNEKLLYDRRYLKSNDQPASPPRKVRRTRESVPRRDYTKSSWYTEYVVDDLNLYNDPSNRNGKIFRQRFCLDKQHVWEVVDKVKAAGFWSDRPDASGRTGIIITHCYTFIIIIISL